MVERDFYFETTEQLLGVWGQKVTSHLRETCSTWNGREKRNPEGRGIGEGRGTGEGWDTGEGHRLGEGHSRDASRLMAVMWASSTVTSYRAFPRVASASFSSSQCRCRAAALLFTSLEPGGRRASSSSPARSTELMICPWARISASKAWCFCSSFILTCRGRSVTSATSRLKTLSILESSSCSLRLTDSSLILSRRCRRALRPVEMFHESDPLVCVSSEEDGGRRGELTSWELQVLSRLSASRRPRSSCRASSFSVTWREAQLLPHVQGLLVGLLSGLHLGPQLLVLRQLQVGGRHVSDALLGGHRTDQLAAPQKVVLRLEGTKSHT
ncbi:hypothetical protein EYF80_042199 [Liparis tanakae]|uniref:Uncharacterized protein n=1 Tax=Liparis tanakae TaxID=230148 RepID=A0A4Z2G212_9TELE|nr:hypothetical protein EYF80_042199 [Liparis tanakae]